MRGNFVRCGEWAGRLPKCASLFEKSVLKRNFFPPRKKNLNRNAPCLIRKFTYVSAYAKKKLFKHNDSVNSSPYLNGISGGLRHAVAIATRFLQLSRVNVESECIK